MPRLTVTLPDGRHEVFEITKPVLKLGRVEGNDVVLADGSVSRFHAEVHKNAEGTVSIVDRGSTNGVVVEGKKISAETPLADGAQIKIGVFGIKFEAPQESGLVVESAKMPETLREVLQGNALYTEYRRMPVHLEKEETPQEKIDRL